jgi:hypothetical protein
MDILEMHKRFDLIIDKVGSPYLTSDEKDSFLQRGEVSFVNSFFSGNRDKYVGEDTDKNTERISPLIDEFDGSTDLSGRISFPTINFELSTPVMYIMNVGVKFEGNGCGSDNYVKSRFVRHNDFFAHQNNEFKKGSDEFPVHRYFNDYIKVTPSTRKDVYLTVCREPIKVTLDDPNDSGVAGTSAISSELDDKVHDEVLLYALRSAGINIREIEFYQMLNQEQDKGV